MKINFHESAGFFDSPSKFFFFFYHSFFIYILFLFFFAIFLVLIFLPCILDHSFSFFTHFKIGSRRIFFFNYLFLQFFFSCIFYYIADHLFASFSTLSFVIAFFPPHDSLTISSLISPHSLFYPRFSHVFYFNFYLLSLYCVLLLVLLFPFHIFPS